MTRDSRSTLEPVDESWVAHLRDLSSAVEPPTSANPHVMSRVAIRRTRTRRAAIATGGGVLTVAAVAGAAFALGGPTVPRVLLPGGSPPAASTTSADPASGTTSEVPAGWHVHELEGFTYALPPEIVTSGPVQDEPGVTSDMWHSSEDPDAPPFLRMAYYAEGSDSPAWPDVASKPDGDEFDLSGAERATVTDAAAMAAGAPERTEVPQSWKGPAMLVIERADGPGAYVINLNLPTEGSKEFVEEFRATLSLS
ncbi:hypothetical protein APR04_001909 [Promicromonospora umidemergens]|uniref:Uncharacterized protein n=1 Tax=Promicromonospora umidemergens TaxID=629679 RepID=A0ABP8XCS5_9MICO|nr:hypothetical protein [Promicromonospora umidemergens]MCP2283006.1 hypothetical protein [Promicromonospora umidemergens]